MRKRSLLPAAVGVRECEFTEVHCLAPPSDGVPLSRKAANKFAVATCRKRRVEVRDATSGELLPVLFAMAPRHGSG